MTNLLSFNLTGLILGEYVPRTVQLAHPLLPGLYLAPLGCVIFIVEWQKLFYDPVVKYFPFLKHHTGRAAFYLL